MSIKTKVSGVNDHPIQLHEFLANVNISQSGIAEGFAVSQASPLDMKVSVALGRAFLIKDDNSIAFPVLSDAEEELQINSNGTGNPRIDTVVLYYDEGEGSPGSGGTNVAKLLVVEGTPSATPSAPSDSDIITAMGGDYPYIALADVDVASGETEITDSEITDRREDFELTFNKNTILNVAPLYVPRGTLINGKIVPSVDSNNLTVEIKGLDGNDPSASNPVYIRIDDTIRSITSAFSVTLNAGTNWCGLGDVEFATLEQQLFVYIGYNATDGLTIGVSRIPYANEYGDFSHTSTNWSYGAINDETNATSSDSYELIGRFNTTLSGGAGYTWTVPTFNNTNLIQKPIYCTDDLDVSPSFSGITAGNGTKTFKYRIEGKLCRFKGNFEFGSTSAMSSIPNVNLPFPTAYSNSFSLSGDMVLYDSGTAYYPAMYTGTGNAIRLRTLVTSGTYPTFSNLSATIPFTWTTGDIFLLDLIYPIAN